MSKDKIPSDQYLAFLHDFQGARPDVSAGSMFGMSCMKRGGKAFAGGFGGGLVVKRISLGLRICPTRGRSIRPVGADR